MSPIEDAIVSIARSIEAKRDTGRSSREIAEEIVADLDIAGFTIRKKPSTRRATAPREPVEVFAPNTGNPAVDAFMRAHHNPKYKPLPLPKAPGMKPLRVMTVSEQDAAERAYRSEAKLAAEDIAQGKMPEAERTLRELIALHRNPWVRTSTVRNGDSVTTTYESARHGDVRILKIDPRDPIRSKTFLRVEVAGVLLPQIHYAIKAAEQAADDAAACAA